MWLQFFLENAHFAIGVFAALVMFAVSWLYFDAYSASKKKNDLAKVAGFGLLALANLIGSTSIETTILPSAVFGNELFTAAVTITKLAGLIAIIIGLGLDRMQSKPSAVIIAGASFVAPLAVFVPVLTAVVGFLYLRRATVGLEHHLKRVGLAFYILALSELLATSTLLEGTNQVDLFRLVAPFGYLWIVRHLITFSAILALCVWVFSYLFKRLFTQLFFIIQMIILGVFLATSLTFTALLVKNVQDNVYSQLQRDAGILTVAIESKKAELLSDAQLVAQHPQVPLALTDVSKQPLKDIADTILLSKKVSTLEIVGGEGQVIVRAHDPHRIGDLLSDDPLVARALAGQSGSSMVAREGVLAKELVVQSATPIKKDGAVVGAVIVGESIDNAFVDGIKKSTGLDTSIFSADAVLSATTLTNPYSGARPVGTRETNKIIISRVLTEGKNYTGEVTILTLPYYASFVPFFDIDNVVAGMLAVAIPQLSVLQLAARTIELTFVLTSLLLLAGLIPAFIISRYLTNQLTKHL